MLAINQNHQEMVVSELKSTFETADSDVTPAHLIDMKYTERVIKETMRLLPPGERIIQRRLWFIRQTENMIETLCKFSVPFIFRNVTADVEFPNGIVPKGAKVAASIMHVHRNPEVWGENVLEFDPDRFLPENIQKRPNFSFIPFSAGQRNCIYYFSFKVSLLIGFFVLYSTIIFISFLLGIGLKYAMMSVKIILAHLLRRYKFTTDLRFEDVQIFTHLVLDIANDRPIRFEERNF